MKSVIINENQKGFLFKNGKYVKTLGAGKYWLYGGRSVEVAEMDEPVSSMKCNLNTLLADADFASQVSVAEVADNKIVLHFINDVFAEFITEQGKHVFWNAGNKHTFYTFDISVPMVGEDFPKYVFGLIPYYEELYKKVEVKEYQKARLYYNNCFECILEPGTYYFWTKNAEVKVEYADTRLLQMSICGQEIMTKDKVALRINFVCNYRIKDYVKIATEIENYEEQMHVAVQLALRDYVGKYSLDEILDNKEELSQYVLGRLKEKEAELYVDIREAGVKDIILPGEIRNIMNTVLMAEKKAQANVIARREEVASTRSLLNTAKLMDENQTLYKLKELECVEHICENVGNINLNGSGDILAQLLGLMGDKKAGK